MGGAEARDAALCYIYMRYKASYIQRLLLWTIILLHAPMLFAAPAAKNGQHASAADSLMNILARRIEAKECAVGEASGSLYVKQRASVEKRNYGLNFIPGMPRFDRDRRDFLSELCYDFIFFDYAIPQIRRRAALSSHRHGSGEIERVLLLMAPNIFAEKMFEEGYLSPLHRTNLKYYRYSLDTLYRAADGGVKVNFEHRFDNIKLLEGGYILLDDSCNVQAFCARGWDEQGRFEVAYTMGREGLRRFLPQSVSLSMQYSFAGNRLNVAAEGFFRFETALPVPETYERPDEYNLSIAPTKALRDTIIKNTAEYVAAMRPRELTASEVQLYAESKASEAATSATARGRGSEFIDETTEVLYSVGDKMISSHSLKWDGGEMRMSPIINPSYLSYSTGRGLSYKMSLNLRNIQKDGREFLLRPMVGYNFKQGAVYWDVDGRYLYSPRRIGEVGIDVGSGNRTYSSEALKRIEQIAADSLNFENLNLGYFRSLHVNLWHSSELANGLELLLGTNYHRRTLIGSAGERLTASGVHLKKRYVQFAPHVRLTWQPGMYYYVKGSRKVNVGSRMPRFSLDVEQAVRGLFGSTGVYTRAELDVQYNFRVNGSDALFLRSGGGGFFYTKDTYFVDYAFLRHNSLPIDRSDELDGVFQLLDSEWYNAANKYFRLNATYQSPFLVLQKMLPRVNFIKNERLYFNMLFISHLLPYSEVGYGIGTPYIDLGLFVCGKNHQFHKIGFKISVSLFQD